MGGGEIVVSSGEEATIMEMMGTLGKPDSESALDMGLGQGTETANQDLREQGDGNLEFSYQWTYARAVLRIGKGKSKKMQMPVDQIGNK